jgi:hypothetical protein
MSVAATLANGAWYAANTPAFVRFGLALENPGQTQRDLLMGYIRRNRDTRFGAAHGFAEIRSPEDFARHVPLQTYEDLEPWIDRIAAGEKNILTTEPVTRLVPTSGSTHARKLIPYTATFHRELHRAIGPWICDLFQRKPNLMLGSAYWSITPLFESSAENTATIPIGFDDDSAYLGGFQKRLVDSVMAMPNWVRHVESIEAFQYITLLLLLRCRDLRLISVWHPSFLTQLLDALPNFWSHLIQDIAKGGCRWGLAIPQPFHHVVISAMRAQPSRAKELSALHPSDIARIWPELTLISCWADGHACGAAAALSARFPMIDLQPKGLLATEGVVTIPFAGRRPLAIGSHYYEFADLNDRCLTAEQLSLGESYSVILTQGGGLWRYQLHDRVTVTAFLGKTPCLRFVGKEAHMSDRFGEKLSESFVCKVLNDLFPNYGVRPVFSMLAPDADESGSRYTLYAEASIPGCFSAELDNALCQNPHYEYCRRLGQLQETRVFRIDGRGFDVYMNEMLRTGIRLGDLKPMALSSLDGWSQKFQGRYLTG